VPALGYVIVSASDLQVSVAFYRDVIGLRLKFIEAGFAEFDTGKARFALYDKRRATWLTGQPASPGPAGRPWGTARCTSPAPTGSSGSSPDLSTTPLSRPSRDTH
jgi:lactoylglutathione lyase